MASTRRKRCRTTIDRTPVLSRLDPPATDTEGPPDMTEGFLPRVAFTDAADARDCYFAVAAQCHGAGDDLSRAAKDDSVTRVQLQALLDKHDRLNTLAGVIFDEWQRLDDRAATGD